MQKISTLAFTLVLTLSISFVGAQTHTLEHFDRISVSPRIALKLTKGSEETVRFEFDQIDPDKINFKVSNKKLTIYLDDARTYERSRRGRHGRWRESIYKGGRVTAYVTYRTLKKLVMKGEEDVSIPDPIDQASFVLRLYGESDVDIASLQTQDFKAALYGENELTIREGGAASQVYALYGENRIRTENFHCDRTRTTSFGESNLLISSDAISVTAFGETQISYVGSADVNRRLILGETRIRQADVRM